MDVQTDGIKRKRFLWGVGLAWTPFLFLTVGLFSAFRGISREKATGLAAVAGGLGEFFSTFGLAAILVFEVAAIILLLRTFSGGRPVRALFSVISICCSGFMLTILGLFLWFVFRPHP
jgi:uncharacterized membrane protein YjjB (DUF3815 family)